MSSMNDSNNNVKVKVRRSAQQTALEQVEQHRLFRDAVLSKLEYARELMDTGKMEVYVNDLTSTVKSRFQIPDLSYDYYLCGTKNENGYEIFLFDKQMVKALATINPKDKVHVITYGRENKDRIGKRFVYRHPLDSYRVGHMVFGPKPSSRLNEQLIEKIR